ncbi:CRTAC1 family protein [Occallatibacter savannae]|uniref:CRTAC1 family protein n=1 Tax=Occallatibacter savannae TaxID=1002691 RepID=UPI0013A539D7|nr:CRTAC1 family protein [Occallatibacter savannae]
MSQVRVARLLSTLLILSSAACLAQSPKPPAEPAPKPNPAVPGKFVDVTSKVGVQFLHQAPHTSRKYLIETMGSGVALFDCDNDGRLDLFLVNGAPYTDPTPKGFIPQKTGPEFWNRMYHQKADGTFEDVTEKASLKGIGYGMGVAAADYDNDGYEDLYVTAYGGNRLYHNNGNCTFTDVTDKAGVAGGGWSSSAAWVDLDNDGLLDLVVDRYVTWDWEDVWCGEHREGYRGYCHPDVFQPITMLVYHNDGNGHFTEVAHKLGLDKPAKALGIAFADYDLDGRMDIFVANDSMPEFLFHQKKNGTFEEVGLETGAAVNAEGQTYAGMGVDFADYDNDGWPDIIVDDLANQRYALYQNNRDSTFNYASAESGIGAMTLLHSGWSLRFLDYDNDGWKDLLVAQGHDLDTIERINPQFHYREPMLLARNTGQKFVDVSPISGDIFHEAWVGRGMAVGDIDNDGRIDAVVTTNGGPAYVLLNQTEHSGHWLTLRLIGHKSNRDGIGAVVEVETPAGKQWATATTSSGYLSSSDPRVHFGLGESPAASCVEIRWPSGILQTLTGVKSDRQVEVDEPAASASSGCN